MKFLGKKTEQEETIREKLQFDIKVEVIKNGIEKLIFLEIKILSESSLA